jgi:hypothetical protein
MTLVEKIATAVSEETGVSIADLCRYGYRGISGPRNPRHIAARRVLMIVLHRHAGYSLIETAFETGHHAHSCICEGIRLSESGADDGLLPTPSVAMAARIWAQVSQSRPTQP